MPVPGTACAGGRGSLRRHGLRVPRVCNAERAKPRPQLQLCPPQRVAPRAASGHARPRTFGCVAPGLGSCHKTGDSLPVRHPSAAQIPPSTNSKMSKAIYGGSARDEEFRLCFNCAGAAALKPSAGADAAAPAAPSFAERDSQQATKDNFTKEETEAWRREVPGPQSPPARFPCSHWKQRLNKTPRKGAVSGYLYSRNCFAQGCDAAALSPCCALRWSTWPCSRRGTLPG